MTLRIEHLSRRFGSLIATNDVSFNVAAGSIHGLIGPNGSGKSTMLNLISGFLKPNRGTVALDGRRISGLAPHAVSRAGAVRTFQLIKIFEQGTVRDNVRMAVIAQMTPPWSLMSRPKALSLNEIEDRASGTLGFMRLEDVADRIAGTLPGGLQRTLSVASALATSPRVLLLDEPLAGLNATEKARLADRIVAINESGVAILLVEHDVRTVLSLCHRITVLNFGRKIGEGTPAEIGRDRAVMDAYLGTRTPDHA